MIKSEKGHVSATGDAPTIFADFHAVVCALKTFYVGAGIPKDIVKIMLEEMVEDAFLTMDELKEKRQHEQSEQLERMIRKVWKGGKDNA